MRYGFPRRRVLELALSSGLISACGQLSGDSAQPASRSLPPCTIEIWFGGQNRATEGRFRDAIIPGFRARFPMVKLTLAGVPPPAASQVRPLTQGAAQGSLPRNGVRPSLGSVGIGARNGTLNPSRRPTNRSDTFNPALVLAASGLPSDVMLAGSGNVVPVGLNGVSTTISNRTVRQLFGNDVSRAGLEQVTFRGAYLGVPFLANPREYVWKQSQLPAGSNGRLPATWEETIEAGTRPPTARSRPPQRRPFVVTGLHIEFLSLIRTVGGTATENGRAAIAGQEGEEAARFIVDRGSTDLGSRLGTPSVWQPDISNDSAIGGWITLSELQETRHSAPATFASVRLGRPIVPGGSRYHVTGNSPVSSVTMATHSWWTVGRQSRVADQAHALLAYLIEPEPMLAIAETSGHVPIRRSLIGRGFLAEPLLAEFARSYADAGAPPPLLANAAEMEDALLNRLNAMVRGEMTPRRAVREVANLWNETLERVGYLD